MMDKGRAEVDFCHCAAATLLPGSTWVQALPIQFCMALLTVALNPIFHENIGHMYVY